MNPNPTIRWPDGRRAAVTLSYDDGLPVHFEVVAPTLEAAGLRGTFYVPVFSGVLPYAQAWRELAARGHEIGNHSLFHPCVGGSDREWLDPVYDLRYYSARRWQEEMAVANYVLHQIDGQTERTFGNTCYDNQIGTGETTVAMESLFPQFFTAARGSEVNGPVNLQALNFYDLGTKDCDQMSFDTMRTEIEGVIEAGGWIIYTLHGVGKETHAIFNDVQEHARLVQWLGENQTRVWTAPLIQVVRHLRSLS